MSDYKALEAPAAGSPKHTPGPWVLQRRVVADIQTYTVRDAQGYEVATAALAPRSVPGVRRGAAAEANAKLIAAAPALADALEALLERLDGDRHFVNPDGGAEMLVAAEAALRAAGRLP